MNLKNKRGVLGLEMATSFTLAILILAVFGFVVIVIMGNLENTTVGRISISNTTINETLPTVDQLGEDFDAASVSFNPSCTIVKVLNATDAVNIPSSNYTQTNCNLKSNADTEAGFNGSNWLVTYTYTFDDPSAVFALTRNTTGGISNLMSNSITWFSLIAVVIIILIISVVVLAVKKFGGGSADFG